MPRIYDLNEDEAALLEDLKISVYTVFLPLYGDKWDELLWRDTIGTSVTPSLSFLPMLNSP
jgi:hypothetical protein